jgi:hypothetical protein
MSGHAITRFVNLIAHVGGDLAFLALGTQVGLHRHQVDDSLETILRSDGQLHRDDRSIEFGVQFFEDALKAGVVAIHLVDKHQAG